MSSILDALKKAEQESTADSGSGTPWPAPLPARSPYRQRTRRWWVPLGIVVGVCVFGVVFWLVRKPDISGPSDSISAVPPPQSYKPIHTAPSSPDRAPKPDGVVAEKQNQSVKTVIDAPPRHAAGNASASAVQASAPMAAAPPVQPEGKSLPTASPTAAPRVQPSLSPNENTPRQMAAPTSESTSAAARDPSRRPMDAATATGQPMEGSPDIGKFFRSDPRIDLQALVWAPESAARFVVINNRLIKEGGSVDNIVVVRINPDDVLLAEGSDRWHEAFKVR